MAHRELTTNPQWYRDGVFYELNVKAFADSNGDGIGDFVGLTERLDYVADLGVTALWLLPFYPSPGRDDGYDIADYTSVHPSYGTLASFRRFLRAAHARDLRVITELVLNHTSDQHPWFQRARHAEAGSRWRDFYVWSDDPERYSDARVIFSDFESSNWAWDPVANSYYWHRFYSHQPDLNFDHPPVRAAMLKVLDFWLGLGVDGLRLDAVPYLFERDNTNCENLPETHSFLRALRRHIDERYTGRMLLAEANQWPEDAAEYFGRGDECHMNFHFPLMPRMFMAVEMEDRAPIVDILADTPTLPDNCQWATFLRNHDELTLEMVTEEERDYMYRAYARDPRMRINLGIRRRLAPLLDNDRRRIELLNAVLFALPGTPVVYYGDELGMGDNVYLGDRDGVRTPMHWSPDRNAGFSSASPHRLYLPPVVEAPYHYESLNVEAQVNDPSSLLRWMRQIITLRRRHPVLGHGSLRFLEPENHHVLAFVRELDDERFLMVANLSRFAQQVDLDLAEFAGATPIEVFGLSPFAPVGNEPYRMSLGPYGYLWFSLVQSRAAGPAQRGGPPELSIGHAEVLGDPDRIAEAVASYAIGQRWYAGRSRTRREVRLDRLWTLERRAGRHLVIALLAVEFTDGVTHTYQVPLMILSGTHDEPVGDHVVATLTDGIVVDAASRLEWLADIVRVLSAARTVRAGEAELRAAFDRSIAAAVRDGLPVRAMTGEQSNSSFAIGAKAVVKLIRRIDQGLNPDLEISRFLSGRTGFVPAVLGSWELMTEPGRWDTAAIVTELVEHADDGWRMTLDELSRYFERAVVAEVVPTLELSDLVGGYAARAELLGRRVGEIHRILGSATEPELRPEPMSMLSQRAVYQASMGQLRETVRRLRRARPDDPTIAALIERVVEIAPQVAASLEVLRSHRFEGQRIRVHGDLHLGQVLWTGHDYVVIDFEGEPTRPIGERRIKRSPLNDVAGMVRSYDYAAHTAIDQLIDRGVLAVEQREHAEQWGAAWSDFIRSTFAAAHADALAATALIPPGEADRRALLDIHMVDKALYEIRYELDHRPQMLAVPLRGLLRIVEP